MGLSWWRSGEESACQCRGREFDPWWRKIPHATEQLSPCTTAAELACPRACALQQERPPPQEAHPPRQRAALARRSWRKPAHSMKTQRNQKNKRKNRNNRFYYLWFIEHFLCIRHCPEATNLYNKYLGSHVVPL